MNYTPIKNHNLNRPRKRAIGTYKDHFISTVTTVDPHCLIQFWDAFLEQTTSTLNLLRTSRRYTKSQRMKNWMVSLTTIKPIVLANSKALIYNYPSDRASFETRTLETFVMGWAKLYYGCLKFWLPATKRFCIPDRYKLYLAHCKIPAISEADKTLITAQGMLQAYKQQTYKRTKYMVTHTQIDKKLSDIFMHCNTWQFTASTSARPYNIKWSNNIDRKLHHTPYPPLSYTQQCTVLFFHFLWVPESWVLVGVRPNFKALVY